MTLVQGIESLLFVTKGPLLVKKLALLLSSTPQDVRDALVVLQEQYQTKQGGVQMMYENDKAELVTNPDCAELLQQYLKEETSGELSKSALETLSVIAYRGPVTKPEIEQVRGVNCSMSLRNLLIRGLIEGKDDPKRREKMYTVSFDFLHHLGLSQTRELPDYESLKNHESLVSLLKPLGEDDVEALQTPNENL